MGKLGRKFILMFKEDLVAMEEVAITTLNKYASKGRKVNVKYMMTAIAFNLIRTRNGPR